MPMLGFTVLKEKLLDDSKTQTIRLPRKRPLLVDDVVYIYWKPRTKECEKLGEGIITYIRGKHAWGLTEEDAIKDGFKPCRGLSALGHLKVTLYAKHKGFTEETDLRIITWKWTQRTVEKEK